MKTIIVAFFGAIIPMIILDAVWLSVMIKNFYSKYIGDLMSSNPSLLPALIFYPLYIAGLLTFVVFPLMKGGVPLSKVFIFGAFFGIIAYATYDLTNQATLKNWATIVTVVDLAWGAFITGTASVISVWITRMLG